MDQLHINDLPTELLCQVFDQLDQAQQSIVMRACVRWYEILSSDWYIRRRRLCLCADNMCQDGDSLVEMSRYRAFAVNSLATNRSKDVFLEPLRDFLFGENVVGHLEELQLTQFQHSLTQLFGSAANLHLPSLRKISFQCLQETDEEDATSFRLEAPNLRIMELEVSGSTVSPLVRLFSGQIENLSVTFEHIAQFSVTVGPIKFANLNSLTLIARSDDVFPVPNVSLIHAKLFGRLKYLKLVDVENMFHPFYKAILREAKNLETLIIHGQNMGKGAFEEIGNLQKLVELQLMVYIEKLDTAKKLSLPNLKLLTTFVGSLIPLDSVPKLRTLSIKNHTPFRMRFFLSDAENLHSFFRVFSQQLEVLRLDKTSTLFNSFAKAVCTMKRLKVLEMVDVETEQKDIELIVGSLKQLQKAHFVRCNALKKYANVTSKNFYGKLRRQNVDCQIGYKLGASPVADEFEDFCYPG
ncbi:uncharacterized protein LOC131693418 [Topomyia yanbarensis]|uniref:uncharacterized protein LOC131693418 n=1 Tax=Topomyia yanbarensis TaxID=2498891 RepID=UPI00273C96ED|nr:uncharacterized protein LOC131693418 [Topomyia yanbarensis]